MAPLAYLVRHARAEQRDPGGDAARRLTEDGRAEFTVKARRLAPRLGLTRVLTSPFTRARETAELLAAACGGVEVMVEPRLASEASTGAALLALARQAGGGVALVGHNPELAEALVLAGAPSPEVPPGTVAALDADGHLAWVD